MPTKSKKPARQAKAKLCSPPKFLPLACRLDRAADACLIAGNVARAEYLSRRAADMREMRA